METQIKTKKINYGDLIKETVILTAAVAVISAAVYFFPCAEPDIGEQYFRIGDRAFQFYPAAVVGDHDGFKCGAFDHRISDVRKRIRCENGLYEYRTAVISGVI